ncbi:uncharacterized protein [Chironomus tepperi]|uniref:uncharacterized protein n=1 Tax=Chironomus tepperi TaxID=113505 RepID=UPI00391FC1CC
MKYFVTFVAIFIFTVESESCGTLSQSANQWPWTVSIFSNASNIVLCQGSIISNKQILTAGHCLQQKNPSSLLVYPGFVSNRRSDNLQLVWQVEQINLHPDMKLTSRGRFINGGIVASMASHADLAIATLKQEIQFNDIIQSICLPIDDSIENIEIQGSYSGWNMNVKNIESLNATIEAIGDAELFEIPLDEKRVDFVTGTGFYSQMNSSWMIIGLMTMSESENGTEMNKFISIHKYVNWITNLAQSTSFPSTTSASISSVETSTTLTNSSSVQESTFSSPSVENTSSTSSIENSSAISKTTDLTTEATTKSNVTKTSGMGEKTTDSEQSQTTSQPITTTEENATFATTSNQEKRENSKLLLLNSNNNSSTAKIDAENSQQSTTASDSNTQSITPTTRRTDTTNQQSLSTQSFKTENSSQSNLNPKSPVLPLEKVINSLEKFVGQTTPIGNDKASTETSIVNEKATNSAVTKGSSVNEISSTSGLNINIDDVTEIPKTISSNLQASYNRSVLPRLPESRDLKDFSNNVSQAIESLSTISNSLPSIISTTSATTTRNPIEEDIITKTSLSSVDSSLNISTEASPSVMNSTESNDNNSTTTVSSEDLVLGGIDFSPAMIITGICIASLLVLFIIFGLLSLSKPIESPH